MANKLMKRCSILLAIMEMKIKTTMRRYHFTPTRVVIVKKIVYIKFGQGCGGTELSWDCKIVQPHWKTVWQFLKRWDVELLYVLVIPHKRMKTHPPTKSCTWMHIAVLFIIATKWKPKGPSTYEWINKMWHMNTKDYYLSIKRNEVVIHATAWTNLENIMLRGRSQSQIIPYYPILYDQNRQINRDKM